MLSPILDPQQPITREDARMFERLARDKSWMGRVDADMREKIVNKLLVGYFRLSVNEGMSQEELRNNLTILDRIAKTFGLLDRVDAEREKAMASVGTTTVNNTQINNLVGVDLSKLTTEQLRALAHDDNPNP